MKLKPLHAVPPSECPSLVAHPSPESTERMKLVTFLVTCVLLEITAANLHLEVNQDTRRVIDLGVFAFSKGGIIKLDIPSFIVFPDAILADPNFFEQGPIGFVLDPVTSPQAARVEKNNANDDSGQSHVCFIVDPEVKPADPSMRYLFPIQLTANYSSPTHKFQAEIAKPALYALFFYNCKGFHANGTAISLIPVSFSISATMYNFDANGKPNYLSYGTESLPYWYSVFGLLFCVLSYIWWKILGKHPNRTQAIHKAMFVVVILKGISLLLEAVMLFHYSSSGHHSVWDFFYYSILGVKGTLLFAVLLLLGSGWSVVKAFLSDSDKKILMVLIPCQIIIDICLAIIGETSEGNRSWATTVMILNVLDLFCCCCVLLPIVWSIKTLHSATAEDDKAVQTLSRLKQFRSFYIVVVGYIYFTRIVVVMMEEFTPFDKIWVPKAIRELAAVLFYTYAGVRFSPANDNTALREEDQIEVEARQEASDA